MASVRLLLDDRGGTIVLECAVDDSEEVTVVDVQSTLEEVPVMERGEFYYRVMLLLGVTVQKL